MITIQQIPLEKIRDKRVLVLIDPNIEKAAPTLGSLIGKSARLIVATHVEGRGSEQAKRLELDFAKELSRALGVRVQKLDDAVGSEVARSILEIKRSEIILLENLSIYTQDAANEVSFSRQLASFCDLFVDDAFEVSHRSLASNVGIARWAPISVAGPWLGARVKELQDFCVNPTRPSLAIVGGGDMEIRLPLLHSLLPNVDWLFVGGALAFSFLRAIGHQTGKASIDAGFLGFIRDFVRKAETHTELILPKDFIICGGEGARSVSVLSPMDLPVDIGVRSRARLRDLMNGAYSILWVGSLGADPREHRPTSDWEILQQLYATFPRRWQRVVVAGHDLVSSLSMSSDSSHFSHLSLFGDAALSVIAGRWLPAVDVLHVDAIHAKDRHRKPVLVPVDRSDDAIRAVHLLSSHIDLEDADVHLLYVNLTNPQIIEVRQNGDDTTYSDVKTELISQPVCARLERELARYGSTAHHQVREGDPAKEILEYATEIHAELIVVGSQSYSAKVLSHAKCPVLIVPPLRVRSSNRFVRMQVAEKSK